MSLHVWPTPMAEAHILELGDWWRENTSVPGRFQEALAHAFSTLAKRPHAGTIYEESPIPGVRRLRLHGTPYSIYYRPEVEEGEVVVLAVWSSIRGEGPPLGRS